MVKLGFCRRCGEYLSEAWTRKERCPVCGRDLEHMDHDTGWMDRLPRVLNGGGTALVVLAFVLIIVSSIGSGISNDTLGMSLIVLAIGVGFFSMSLMLQLYIIKKAISERKVLDRPIRGMGRAPVRTGRAQEMTGQTQGSRGKKILVGRP